MDSNIQNKFNYQPYNPNNVVSKPITAQNIAPQAKNQADEEKSNAMKWMVGLTATATIVIGGLYAAKHGHLGKDAEKFAKKLFGEGVKEGAKEGSNVNPTPKPTPTVNQDELAGGGDLDPNLLAFIPLAVLRKVVRTPKIKHADVLAELQKLKVDFKFGKLANGEENANRIILRTDEKALPTILDFRPDGLLREIRKPFNNSQEIFSYENGILRSIKRYLPTKKSGEFVEHITEFGTTGKKVVKQKFKFNLDDETINIESVEGKAKLFEIKPEGGTSSFDVHRLSQRLGDVPEIFHDMKFVSGKTVTTPKIEKIASGKINHITLEGVKSDSYVESLIPRDSKYFDQAVQELNMLRAQAHRLDLGENIDFSKVLGRFVDAHNNKIEESFMQKTVYTPERLAELISTLTQRGDKVHGEIFKLIQKDIGNMKSVSFETVARMASNYQTVLSTYKITKPEHIATAGKAIKDCSFNEFMGILREVAPKFAGQFHLAEDFSSVIQEKKAIMHIIKLASGRSNINRNTSLMELLKDLAGAGEIRPTTQKLTPQPIRPKTTSSPKSIGRFQTVRKGVAEIIKNPNKNQEQILAEMQKIGASVERKADNILEIKTGAKPEDVTRMTFNPDGTLSTVQRATKQALDEVFTFENGKLSSIKRIFSTNNPDETLKYLREFKDGKLVSQSIGFNNEGTEYLYSSMDGKPNSFEFIPILRQYLSSNIEILPKPLKSINLDSSFSKKVYTPRCNAKLHKSLEKIRNSKIPSAEFIQAVIEKGEKGYQEAIDELNILRKTLSHTEGINSTSFEYHSIYTIASEIRDGSAVLKNTSDIPSIVEDLVNVKELAAPISKMILKDMGSVETISEKSLNFMIQSYYTKFLQYGITPDKFSTVTLSLKNTSKADILKLLNGNKEKVDTVLKGCFDDFTMLDVEYMRSLPQFKHVKPEMTLFDIIQHLA